MKQTIEASPYLTAFHAKKEDGIKRLDQAARTGDIETMRELLTNPEWIGYIDIHTDDDLALNLACEYGHLDLVAYL